MSRTACVRGSLGASSVAAALVFAACATTVDGTGRVDPAQVSSYQVDQSSDAVRRSQDVRENADYTACSTATSTIVTALRAYNVFVTRLNATQSYDRLAGADTAARTQLTRGVTTLTGVGSDAVSAPIRAAVTGLVARTGELARAIEGRERDALNTASTAWTRARDGLIATCRPFTAGSPSASSAPSGAPSLTRTTSPSTPGG